MQFGKIKVFIFYFYFLTYTLESFEESQDRNMETRIEGAQEEHCLLASFYCLLGLLSYTIHNHLLRGGMTHSVLDPPSLVMNKESSLWIYPQIYLIWAAPQLTLPLSPDSVKLTPKSQQRFCSNPTLLQSFVSPLILFQCDFELKIKTLLKL